MRKIIKKIKEVIEKKTKQTSTERRKTERRRGIDRRWMSKLVGGPEVPYERRRGGDRRLGERRKK